MARVIVYFDRNKVAHYDFDTGAVRVGRHPDSELFLPHNSVSREHLRLVGDSNGWRVENAGGRNVIFVNGSIVKVDRPLDDRDRVEFGRYILLFLEQATEEGDEVLEDHGGWETGVFSSASAPKPTGSEDAEGTKAYNLSQLRALRARAQKLSKPHLMWMEEGQERICSLGDDAVVIGASEEVDVTIAGGLAVSAEHAIVQQRVDDEFVIEATGWLAKFKVNGEPVKGAHVLEDGDQIEIGKTMLSFRLSMFSE